MPQKRKGADDGCNIISAQDFDRRASVIENIIRQIAEDEQGSADPGFQSFAKMKGLDRRALFGGRPVPLTWLPLIDRYFRRAFPRIVLWSNRAARVPRPSRAERRARRLSSIIAEILSQDEIPKIAKRGSHS